LSFFDRDHACPGRLLQDKLEAEGKRLQIQERTEAGNKQQQSKENKPEDVQHLKEDPELIKAEHNLIEKVHK
jgi:hypothetical protein